MSAASAMAPTFGILAVGFAAGRTSVLPKAAVPGLVAVAANIEIPALLFRGLATDRADTAGATTAGLAYLAATLCVLLVSYAVARRAFALGRAEAMVFGLGAVYSNSSFLGVPLAQALYGPSGLAVLAQVVAIHSLVLLPGLTVAVACASPEGKAPSARSIAKAALNPMVLAMAAGMAWRATGAGLPAEPDALLAALSAAAAPTALLAVGATAATLPLPDRFREPVAAALLKLVLHPLLAFACCTALGVPPTATAVATLTAALPPGVNVYLLATRFGCYAASSAQALALTTAGSAISVAALILATT